MLGPRPLRVSSVASASLTVFLIVCASSQPLARNTDFRCLDRLVTVSASKAPIAMTWSAAASKARAFLKACGLAQLSPLAIREVAALEHGDANSLAFGIFDPTKNEIQVLALEKIVGLLEVNPLTARLNPRLFSSSVVAHEVGHAIGWHNAPNSARQGTQVEHEYAAYVVQLSVMAEDLREQILSSLGGRTVIENEELNEVSYSLSPFVFAAKAYRHFQLPGNGCVFLRNALTGRYRLPRVFMLRHRKGASRSEDESRTDRKPIAVPQADGRPR